MADAFLSGAQILCDTTYDADVPIAEADIDRLTLNTAGFRGTDGARIAAFYRNEAICAETRKTARPLCALCKGMSVYDIVC